MTYLHLTGYYPSRHLILVRGDTVSAIIENVTNENSQGSIVTAGAAQLYVLEEPGAIRDKLYALELQGAVKL